LNDSPPKQNRVTPLGDIVATPLRGAWTGNRGCLHVGTDIVRFHRGNLWITCALEYKDWRAEQWSRRRLTWLFFHDEALALAAGHRPCALCRRPAYNAYRQAWAAGNRTPVPLAMEIDRRLHAERLVPRTRRRQLHERSWQSVPTGAFVLLNGRAVLVLDHALAPWTTEGYLAAEPRPTVGTVDMITPPSTAGALAAGYSPQIDESAVRQEG
jgi:hypothetical protein